MGLTLSRERRSAHSDREGRLPPFPACAESRLTPEQETPGSGTPTSTALPRIPKHEDTPELMAMKTICSIVAQAVGFGLLIVLAVFVILFLPQALTGNMDFLNIFLISILVYFFLYALALLLSWTTSLVYHRSQEAPPTSLEKMRSGPFGPHSPQLQTDDEFRHFYVLQNEKQERILRRMGQMQEELGKLMSKVIGPAEATPADITNKTSDPVFMPQRKSGEERPSTSTSKPECPSDLPCQGCSRENRPCTACLRNPTCPCKGRAASEERVREFGWDQETQVTKMVEQTKIHKKLKTNKPKRRKGSVSVKFQCDEAPPSDES